MSEAFLFPGQYRSQRPIQQYEAQQMLRNNKGARGLVHARQAEASGVRSMVVMVGRSVRSQESGEIGLSSVRRAPLAPPQNAKRTKHVHTSHESDRCHPDRSMPRIGTSNDSSYSQMRAVECFRRFYSCSIR